MSFMWYMAPMDRQAEWRRPHNSIVRDTTGHMNESLLNAYRNTTYEVHADGRTIGIRIGKHCAALDDLLGDAARSWAFVTAVNPESRVLPEAVNAERNAELKREIERCGWSFWPGVGRPDGGDWSPEPSFLVVGISREQAAALGARYGQNAVVWGRVGGVAELVACTGA